MRKKTFEDLLTLLIVLSVIVIAQWDASKAAAQATTRPDMGLGVNPDLGLQPLGLYPEDVYWSDQFGQLAGVDGVVKAIAVSGSDVYVGGRFNIAGGVPANGIAHWDGGAWHALGEGLIGTSQWDPPVYAIAVNGSDVYVGGYFTTAGGAPANNIARWDGSAWYTLGEGVGGSVYAIAVSGSDVYVGGSFTTAGGVPANRIARWDGSAWHTLGEGLNPYGSVNAIAVSGSDVYVGGSFTTAGGVPANRVARWDGNAWHGLGQTNTLNGEAYALATSQGQTYVGGTFTHAGNVLVNGIARWDGSAWHALGAGLSGGVNWESPVSAIAIDGADVYVGGYFTTAGGAPANHIARWDGSAWHALGEGVGGSVRAIAVSGNNVYVGGWFTTAGGTPANRVARWDGSAWHALGEGAGDYVYAIAVSGNNVYVGGNFNTAGGTPANHVAHWDGSAWYALGEGVVGYDGTDYVNAIAISGSDVYVGGRFNVAGGVPANGIARWDGSAWHALGEGVDGSYETVNAITVNGENIYVAGDFDYAGGETMSNVARWDGSTWSRLGSGVSYSVDAIAVGDGGVYVGGDFTTAGGKLSYYFGNWHPATLPGLVVDTSTGAPGSAFTFAAVNFPVNSPATITVNGFEFPLQTTDANGGLIFAIHTDANAPEGLYRVTFSVNPEATAWFEIDSEAPLLTAPGLTPLELPAAVLPARLLFLPLIGR